MLGDVMHDVRFGLRTLGRSPGFTTVAVLTLAVGIGANTAMFSLVDGVLLEPLPYGQGDRIVHLRQQQRALDNPDMRFSVREVEDFRERVGVVTDLVEYHSMTFTMLGHGPAARVATGVVSSGFFDVLGLNPALGRTFSGEDEAPGSEPVLMLSHGYWVSRFGSDPSVIGRGLELNGKIYTVIGVLPPVPQFPRQNDIYMPTSQCPMRSDPDVIADREHRMLRVLGVLGPGSALEDARREVSAAASQIAGEHPGMYQVGQTGYGVDVRFLKEDLVGSARPALLILLGTSSLILLIACANIAGLALARAVRRGDELSVRTALGAGRGRLARQLLTENVLLALLGGAAGVLLARTTLGLMVRFAERFTPRAFEASVDGSALTFALVVSVATGLLFGTLPALRWSQAGGAGFFRGRSSPSGERQRRVQQGLVVLQTCLAFVLLVGAGLLGRTYQAVQSVDLGFRSGEVLSATITLPETYYGGDGTADDVFWDELLRRLEALPSVVSAARTQRVPLGGGYRTGLETEENAGQGREGFTQVVPVGSSPEYFETLGVEMTAGRPLGEEDRVAPTNTVVLTETLARRLWAAGPAVGRRVRVCSFGTGQCGAWLGVVGVAEDIRMEGLDREPSPVLYLPTPVQTWGGGNVVVRAGGDLSEVGSALTRIVQELEPQAPVSDVRGLDEYVADQVAPRRLTATLMATFAGLALLVTLAGVAGVVAFTTSQRRHEIGVRLALGADPARLLGQTVRSGMAPVATGLGLGLLVALALSGLLSRLIWGVQPTDVTTFVGAGVALAVATAIACWLPARKGTRVDPVRTLRME